MADTYQRQKNKNYTLLIQNILQNELPDFASDYFRNLLNKNMSVTTRYGYAIEIKNFFQYLCQYIRPYQNLSPVDFTIEHLNAIKPEYIEMYLEYCSIYEKETVKRNSDAPDVTLHTVENHERAIARKLSAIRSFLKYYYKMKRIDENVAAIVDAPKIHDKAIIRLEANEVADFLDDVEIGSNLTVKQKKYHESTRIRDLAILTLFLGTGIRISELVGIDIEDIDFASRSFRVTRKGGKQDVLSFGSEVAEALDNYRIEREKITPLPGSEHAYFLSLQRKRITARAVENLVKKYASVSIPMKKITPHKLRSTFGTMLYQETGDIYLVADVLGHKDVNTTKKHYAAQSEENKRYAAKMIHLRDES